MYNDLYTSYTMADGRVFEAKRGKVSADIGYESHGMFVMKLKWDWGPYTFSSVILDYCEDYDVPSQDQVRHPQPYLYDLLKNMLKVFNVDYIGSIQNAEAYILFSEDNDKRNEPLGFVNIKDTQNVFLLSQFLEDNLHR